MLLNTDMKVKSIFSSNSAREQISVSPKLKYSFNITSDDGIITSPLHTCSVVYKCAQLSIFIHLLIISVIFAEVSTPCPL